MAGLVALVVLAGCGGDDEGGKTVTVVQTVTVTAPAATPPAATTGTDPAATATTATPPAAAPPGLPADAVAVSGRFTATVVDTRPSTANASAVSRDTEEEWTLETACAAPEDCTLTVRRKLESGGYEDIELRPDEERPGLWYGEFDSRAQCGARYEDERPSTLTLRPSGAQGQVAEAFEAYWRANIDCLEGDSAIAKYRGRPATG